MLTSTGALADGAKGLPTGSVVGTTDTQTLTNKTLTSPDINGGTWNGTIDGDVVVGAVTLTTTELSYLDGATSNIQTQIDTITSGSGFWEMLGPYATTSGTSVSVTGIPSWANEITVTFRGLSTNGTSRILLQLGGVSIDTTNYLGAVTSLDAAALSTSNVTNGIGLTDAGILASAAYQGSLTITRLSGNTWAWHGGIGSSTSATQKVTSGSVALVEVLTQLSLTTNGGTDTFDAGTMGVRVSA